MDDGEVDFSNQEVFSSTNMYDVPSSGSMDSLFDELLRDAHACTHTHTCNPPGPDSSHTHTCFHVHTKLLPAPSEEKGVINDDDSAESMEKKVDSKKRPVGNREAVRKYRQKKKAEAASLEDEVKRLRAVNHLLSKKLQGYAALEAENARLKCLLVDLRGRIDGEIGSFPYERPVNLANTGLLGSYVVAPCNMQSSDQAYCLHPGAEDQSREGAVLDGQGIKTCDFENLNCLANIGSGSKEPPGCGMINVGATANTCRNNKRKRGI